jgi:hypothetical protein
LTCFQQGGGTRRREEEEEKKTIQYNARHVMYYKR